MKLPPEILVACGIGWFCLAIATAYFFGKLKSNEPNIEGYANKEEREQGTVNP